jgi:hypothetical protein
VNELLLSAALLLGADCARLQENPALYAACLKEMAAAVQSMEPEDMDHPLSPAAVRVDELRERFTARVGGAGRFIDFLAERSGSSHLKALSVALTDTAWPASRPIFVDALKYWRMVRHKAGDPRPLPED